MRYASAAAAPARAAMRGRASPTPPRDTLPPTRPPRPPRERASVLNRGDPSPIYTRRPGTYKRASGSSSSGGDSGDSGAAGTIIISITASRRWRGQRGLVLGCSRPRRLHPERYRLATARGGALPWLWGSDGGLFPHVYMVLFGQRNTLLLLLLHPPLLLPPPPLLLLLRPLLLLLLLLLLLPPPPPSLPPSLPLSLSLSLSLYF